MPINSFPEYELRWIKDAKGQLKPHNFYRDIDIGMGGYVDSTPGMYTNVALLDSASHHPTSAIQLNYFGEYTPKFKEILDARLAIKHGDYESAKKMFDGKLSKYLDDPKKAKQLAQALKIAINSVYGLTSAKFENPFYNSKNVNNIVALRGALFIKLLQDEVTERGFQVIHCKTDSIKIPNANPDIIKFVFDFGQKYGYTFEHEATYDRMCLINDADYIAKYLDKDKCRSMYGYIPEKNEYNSGKWTATGAQFAKPFVFKTLFSKDPIEFEDMRETKEVKSSIYLDHNENLPNVEFEEKLLEKKEKEDPDSDECRELREVISTGHNYKFVGRIGLFTPVISGVGGGLLLAFRNGKYASIGGTKGYRWLESETVKQAGLEDKIDLSYYRHLVDDAIENISKYGDFNWFVGDDDPPSEVNHPPLDNDVPWLMPCGDPSKTVCEECPEFCENGTCKYLRGAVL